MMWIRRHGKARAAEPDRALAETAGTVSATASAMGELAPEPAEGAARLVTTLPPAEFSPTIARELEELRQRVQHLETELQILTTPAPRKKGPRLARTANDLADLATIGLIFFTLGAWILSPIALALGALALSRAHLHADPKAARALALLAIIKACLTLIAAAVLLQYILNYLSTRI